MDISEATSLVMEGNHVAGAERAAYNLPHQGCTGAIAGSASWKVHYNFYVVSTLFFFFLN